MCDPPHPHLCFQLNNYLGTRTPAHSADDGTVKILTETFGELFGFGKLFLHTSCLDMT